MTQPNQLHALKLKENSINDLDEDLKKYFTVCEDKIGFVPNVLKSYSWNQNKLRSFSKVYNEIMLGESLLSKLEREMIAVVISSANYCYYCQVAHGAAVRSYSSDPILGELLVMDYRSANLSKRHRAMLDFSWKLTKTPYLIEESDRATLRKKGFHEEEIWDICEVVGFFNMTNRLASGVGMMPNIDYHGQNR